MSLNLIELHSIIHSMTRSQKRRFTMHFNRNKANSNAWVLFKALNELEIYDKEQLMLSLEKNNKHTLAQNLTQETAVLYNLVLKKIIALTNEKSIEDKLKNTFKEIVFLQERGLFAKARRMLKKLKKEAIECKQNMLLLDISEFERRIKRNANTHKDLNAIQEVKKEELELVQALESNIKFIKQEIELRDIYDKIFFLSQNVSWIEKSKVKAKLDEIETALNKIDETQCKHFTTKILYLNSLTTFYHLKGKKEAVFECIEKMQQIYKTNKNDHKTSDFQYIKFLANYLNYIVRYKQAKEQFLDVLTQLKSIKTNSPYEEMIQFSSAYYSEFLYYLKQGDFEKLANLLPDLLAGLKKYDAQIELGRKVTIWYNLMIYYFLMEDFDATDPWIQKIQTLGKKSRRIDVFNKCKLFQLVIQYELDKIKKTEDTQYLESLIGKVDRSFKDADLINLIIKLMNAHCKKRHLAKKDFETTLQKFYQIDKSKNRGLPYDEMEIWLKSKVQGLSMQKVTEAFTHSSPSFPT